MYNNNTRLHYAATLPNVKEDEQFNIIRLLLEKGADKTIRNSQKKLPIELVCQEHQKVNLFFFMFKPTSLYLYEFILMEGQIKPILMKRQIQ